MLFVALVLVCFDLIYTIFIQNAYLCTYIKVVYKLKVKVHNFTHKTSLFEHVSYFKRTVSSILVALYFIDGNFIYILLCVYIISLQTLSINSLYFELKTYIIIIACNVSLLLMHYAYNS